MTTSTTWAATTVYLGDDAQPTVAHTEPSQGRPSGLAHISLGDSAAICVRTPAAALRLADAAQEAARVLRRAELASARAVPGVYGAGQGGAA